MIGGEEVEVILSLGGRCQPGPSGQATKDSVIFSSVQSNVAGSQGRCSAIQRGGE